MAEISLHLCATVCYTLVMAKDNTIITEAAQNIEDINSVRRRFVSGELSYDEAKAAAQPTIDRINDRAKAIAKKYNKRPQLVSFAAIMR